MAHFNRLDNRNFKKETSWWIIGQEEEIGGDIFFLIVVVWKDYFVFGPGFSWFSGRPPFVFRLGVESLFSKR
jgi:hypothetical protein